MSLDSQVALLPYESSSFATPGGKSALLSAFGLIQYEQHFCELAACSGFPPFGAYGTTFPPQKRWDNNPCFA